MDKPITPPTPQLPKSRTTRVIDLTPGPGRVVKVDRFRRAEPKAPEQPQTPEAPLEQP